jgi:hypothetical protein
LKYSLIQKRLCICWGLKWITKKINSHLHLSLTIPMKQNDAAAVSRLRFNFNF